MTKEPWVGFRFHDFWEDSARGLSLYQEARLTKHTIAKIEAELGLRLPEDYLAFMQHQNGGIPRRKRFPTKTPTSWAGDHIAIEGLLGIGRTKKYSICGSMGSEFFVREWGYPAIGVVICTCPSAGHDLVMLDYSDKTMRSPRVVHVDQEQEYRITRLADSFEMFVRGLY